MVKIISDSTCDLSPELLERYDIDILPLHILLGDQEYEDGKNISPAQIYAWSDANKTIPKTSALLWRMPWNFFAPMWKLEERLSAFPFHQGCPRQEM